MATTAGRPRHARLGESMVLNLVVQLDPVDAANGLEVIADVAAQRANEALAAGLVAGEEQREERIPEQLRRFL